MSDETNEGGPEGDAMFATEDLSPAALGFVLLKYVPTTVIGFLFFVAGTLNLFRLLTEHGYYGEYALTTLLLLTIGISLLLGSLGAAFLRTQRAI